MKISESIDVHHKQELYTGKEQDSQYLASHSYLVEKSNINLFIWTGPHSSLNLHKGYNELFEINF
jgi:hypothetical protein